MEARKRRNLTWAFILCAMLLLAVPICANEAGIRADRYVFSPEQSTITQTGGFAGVHWTYSVEGRFCLIVDSNAGSARFEQVDANAVDVSEPARTLDPNTVFNLTGLAGKVVDDAIELTGQTADGSSVHLSLTFENDNVRLTGKTTPPPNSADFFIFAIDAIATRKYAGGTGDPNTPYQIATAADLIALGETPEDYNKHFVLTNDVDLDPNLPGGRIFTRAVIAADTNDVQPGFQGAPFTGVFDGKSHTISNLTIAGVSHLGLFGATDVDARISYLGLEAVCVNGTDTHIGALVGGSVIVWKAGTITACYSTGVVQGQAIVGGLVGMLVHGSQIAESYSTATVQAGDYVGGVVGANFGSLTNCHAGGHVAGSNYVGGLAGQNGYQGRDIGERGIITNCYSTCHISGIGQETGGLVGYHAFGRVTSSFWDVETSGWTTGLVGTGLTTAKMQTAATYLDAGWDFVGETANGTDDVWRIDEGRDYPKLWWERDDEAAL